MKRLKHENPYFISYLGLAMLCCIILSVLFLWITFENTKRSEELHTQEKLCLIAEDMDSQFQSFETINLQISINNLYQPFYFTRNKYYEMTLLNDFTKYKTYSPLLSEYFLYYRNYDTIFHSDHYTMDLSAYLDEKDNLAQMDLIRLLNQTEETCFFYSPDALFVLMPVSSIHTESFPSAVLCMVMNRDALNQRFQTVSGGLYGTLSLYTDNQLLYTDSFTDPAAPSDSTAETKTAAASIGFSDEPSNSTPSMSYQTADGMFTVVYIPSREGHYSSLLLPLQILLVIAAIILVLFVASLFAHHSYKPLLSLTQKYQKTLPPPPRETPFDNKLEELNYMMESILKKNVTANEKLEEYQELLRSQLLILLLNGKYSFDITPYLSQVKLNFPGPCYFVICTIFSGQEAVSPDLYSNLKEWYESLTDPEEQKYIYTVSDSDHRILSSLISIPDASAKEELFNDFLGLTEGCSPLPLLGCGNVCHDLSNLSASYLEALDNARTASAAKEPQKESGAFHIHPGDLYPVISALSNGNESAALEAAASYFSNMEQAMPSLLMQQYLFTNFLNELMRISRECQIELSKQSISLMIAAKGPSQFSSAASLAIQEFCRKFREQKSRLSEDKSYQIYQYINSHFTDYELSIENVAKQFQTNTAFVRSSIQEHTGKHYKDYLIYLRMEYAKKLLVNDRLSVAQTCQQVGYTNISYFIKAFKNHTGVTPANYKNSLWE
ncbi:MAG: helix-turn-helix domain-containing protein [Lachnospiraceae bacterium]